MNLFRGHNRDRETLQTGQSCNLLQQKKKLQDLAVKIFTNDSRAVAQRQ